MKKTEANLRPSKRWRQAKIRAKKARARTRRAITADVEGDGQEWDDPIHQQPPSELDLSSRKHPPTSPILSQRRSSRVRVCRLMVEYVVESTKHQTKVSELASERQRAHAAKEAQPL